MDSLNPVPLNVVEEVPSLLKEAKLGMTRDEVFRQLGLWEYRDHLSGESGGPTENRHTIYHLRQGYNLVLFFDYSQAGRGVFKEAQLAGKGWPAESIAPVPPTDSKPAPVEPQRDESVTPRPRIEVSVQLVKAKGLLEKLPGRPAELPSILENIDWGDQALAKAAVTVESGGKGSVMLRTGNTQDPRPGETTFRADLAPILSADGRFVTVTLAVSRGEATKAGGQKRAMESTIRIPMNRAAVVGGSSGEPEDFWFIVGARMASEEVTPTDTAVAPEPENTAPSPRVLPAVVPLDNLPTAAASTKVIRYTVKRGDTLAAIAKQHLGSETKWREIARENDLLSSENLHLEIGDVLTITVPE